MVVDLEEQRRRRLASKPWAWRNLSDAALADLALSALLDLPEPFNTRPEGTAEELYGALCVRLDWRERTRFIDRVSAEPMFALRETALLTIIDNEFDAPVAAAAAMQLLAGAPIDDNGLPVSFQEVIQRLCADTLANPGAVFAGALMVADRSLIGGLEGLRPLLAVDTVGVAAQCCCGFASSHVIDFWLDWIEALLDNRFDMIAGAYADAAVAALFMPAEALARHEVAEYERVPCCTNMVETTLIVARKWRFDAFRDRIESRMRAIAAHERSPRLMPVILRSWGYP